MDKPGARWTKKNKKPQILKSEMRMRTLLPILQKKMIREHRDQWVT